MKVYITANAKALAKAGILLYVCQNKCLLKVKCSLICQSSPEHVQLTTTADLQFVADCFSISPAFANALLAVRARSRFVTIHLVRALYRQDYSWGTAVNPNCSIRTI